MQKPPRVTGFTLVEVLVAMVIMSVIALMSWQGIDGIVRTRTVSQQKLEQTLRLDTVLAQWEQDLASLQEGYQTPSFAFDGISVRITRRSTEGLQLVVWSLRNGSLSRWVAPAARNTVALKEAWTQSQQLMGNEPQQLRLLEGVSQWQLYCFRKDEGLSNCQSSGDVAQTPGSGSGTPATTQEEPPAGVRLVLSFAEGSGYAGFVTRDVARTP